MGSLFSSKQTTSSSGDPIKQQAWGMASPYYAQGLTTASQINQDISANPAYSGQRVADLNPFQTQSANFLGNFANGFTPDAANAAGYLGYSNLGAGANYGTNAQGIFNRYTSSDPTQSIIQNAGLYANNPYVNGMIDAANRDVGRDLYENQLPGINRAASGTGNLNSSRAGVQDAIAQRGAMDRMADTASNIRGQFFGQGLGMAQNQYNQNLQNSLQANNQLYNAANLGLQGLQGAQGIASTGAGQGITAGQLFQNQNQNVLNGNMAQFNESLQNRLAALGGLNGTTAAGQGWSGGPQTQTTTSSPSLMSSIGGSLLGAGSALSGLGSIGFKW
jgi:hypothetical protein